MREFKKRRSSRGEVLYFCYRLGGTLVLLLITVVAVRAAWGMYGRLGAASAGQQEAEAQLQALQAQQRQITASVGELYSDRGVEALMREHFGVVRPGEGVVQIVHETATTTTGETAPKGWFKQLFHTLFSW
ncbi:MAG: septum formation initiator family protein [Candidatus Adlerbacteria bacterium]